MARAQASDPLHNFRFHAALFDSQWAGSLATDIIGNAGAGGEAGFNSFTSPEITLEWTEYREGVRIYTEKYPGISSVNDITVGRGVARAETNFFEWMLSALENREYRSDLAIYHFPRDALAKTDNAPEGHSGLGLPDDAADKAKTYRLYEAGPGRVKVAGDLDATSGEVSITEMDVVFERFDVLVPTA